MSEEFDVKIIDQYLNELNNLSSEERIRKYAELQAMSNEIRHILNLTDKKAYNLDRQIQSIITKLFVALKEKITPKITRSPGSRLSSIASLLFSKKTYQNQFQNLLADMQHEVFEALKDGKPHKARWEHVKGVFAFWSNVLAYMPIKAFAKLKSFFIAG